MLGFGKETERKGVRKREMPYRFYSSPQFIVKKGREEGGGVSKWSCYLRICSQVEWEGLCVHCPFMGCDRGGGVFLGFISRDVKSSLFKRIHSLNGLLYTLML